MCCLQLSGVLYFISYLTCDMPCNQLIVKNHSTQYRMDLILYPLNLNNNNSKTANGLMGSP